MNRQSLVDLEYLQALRLVSLFADSEPGKEYVCGLEPLEERDEINRRLNLTNDMISLFGEIKGLNLGRVSRITTILNLHSIQGTILEPSDILAIRQNIASAEDVKKLMKESSGEFPALRGFIDEIPSISFLGFEIDRILDESGRIKDEASPTLYEIRNSMASINKQIKKVLEDHLNDERYQYALQDDIITFRNGRFVLMVKSDFKGQMEGIIHDSSSSGQSVFIEPMKAVELNNKLARLQQEERIEIRKILSALTQYIFEHHNELRKSTDILIELDQFQAAARFAIEGDCMLPNMTDDSIIDLVDARHPFLDERLVKQRIEIFSIQEDTSTRVIPISIALDSKKIGMVISGPNMGGKTVSLKTLGLLTLMALTGLPVPAAKFVLPLFKQVSVDIGDQQAITKNISTFASHLLNIKRAIENHSKPSLILLDEVGTGTDPEEGSALARATIDFFIKRESFIVLTTHSSYLKTYSHANERMKSAAVEFDPKSGRPTYRLIEGSPGSSKAISIARSLGFPEDILQTAQSHLQEGYRYIEESIERMDEQRRMFEAEAVKMEKQRRQLEEETQRMEEERTKLEDQRRKFAASLKDSWNEMIDKFKLSIEEITSRLKAKADQMQMKREAKGLIKKLDERIKSESPIKELDKYEEFMKVPDYLPEGTRLRVKELSSITTLAREYKSSEGNKLYLTVDGKHFETTVKSVVEILAAPREPTAGEKIYMSYQLDRTGKARTELNLIGMTREDVREQVEKFLDDAVLAGLTRLRIIHGVGKGVLKKTVSEILSKHPAIESFHTADLSQGGEGATEIILK